MKIAEKLHVKKQQNWYCHTSKKNYFFKETECGRFFVWIPTYEYNAKMSRNIIDTEGHCIELLKTCLDYFIESENKSAEFLSKNTDPALRYQGDPNEKAKKLHEKQAVPYCWSYVINSSDYGNLYVLDCIKKSEHVVDKKGEDIIYDKNFFNSIGVDSSEREKLILELKSILKEENYHLADRFKDSTTTTVIKKFITQIKMENLFYETTLKLREQIKEILPEDVNFLDRKVYHKITFNPQTMETYYDAYSNIY